MKKSLSRSNLRLKVLETFSNPTTLLENANDPELTPELANWLSRLGLLYGVPFNYLVPNEKMLPPESIRFFYLDRNWVSALIDGAFSIGRNLTPETDALDLNLDKATFPLALDSANSGATNIRARVFGLQAAPSPTIISGFVLRSSIVLDYPSLGVNVYPLGGTPNDPPPQMLTLLRLEQLGDSDTIICLVSGDAYRVDIHEAPQALHYGIDCYNDKCTVNQQPALAVKNLYTFTINSSKNPVTGTTTQSVTMSQIPTPTDISSCFRKNNTRTLDMSSLAGLIAKANNVGTIDSSEMGFEMTEGVGMVSFFKTT